MAAPALSWQQMLLKVGSLVDGEGAQAADVHHATIKDLLAQYKSEQTDFEQFLSFDKSGYTKNLVHDFGDQCNVIVMCWSAGQESAFHGHEGSKCFVKVLTGQLVELQVPYPTRTNPQILDYGRLAKKELRRNDVTYIDDSIGLHKVTNKSLEEPAVTLHIYMPAYKKCRVFDSKSSSGQHGALSLNESKTIDVILRTPNRSRDLTNS